MAFKIVTIEIFAATVLAIELDTQKAGCAGTATLTTFTAGWRAQAVTTTITTPLTAPTT